MNVLEELAIDRWQPSVRGAAQAAAIDAVESGRVLHLPRLAFELTPQTIYKTIGPYTKSTWCEESLAKINSGSMDIASKPDISSPLANYRPKAP